MLSITCSNRSRIAELVNAVQKVKSGHLSLDAELKNLVENHGAPHHQKQPGGHSGFQWVQNDFRGIDPVL